MLEVWCEFVFDRQINSILLGLVGWLKTLVVNNTTSTWTQLVKGYEKNHANRQMKLDLVKNTYMFTNARPINVGKLKL